MGISFDLSKTSAFAVANILLPFLPGGTLVLGILLGFPQRAWHDGDFSSVNNLERLALIIFLSYVSGFALVLLVDALSNPVTLVPFVFAQKWFNRSAPWTDPAWRKTARAFLPPGLSPADDNVSDPKKDHATFIGAPDKPESPNNEVSMQLAARFKDTDEQWKCWYGVLSAYQGKQLRETPLSQNTL